ncbi:DMT family transporter [Compostimonas suwonensis]|uniref:DMT family transporter n=1 Tax=Compostimonas suwonensis TaxID=1048394 RepID=UPI000C242888|nr:DMT family transporter [Compostimonas suwonensis]
MLVAAQFVGMGLIWGASFLFMKIALDGVSFGQVAWARLVLGGLTLGVLALIGRERLPKEPIVWLHFVVIAITGCVIPHLLFAWAEQYVSSSLASIYNAVTPIMTAIMVTLVFRVERLARGQVLGVVIGIVGVLVIIGPWQLSSLSGSLQGQLACLGAVTAYGFTYAYMRKFISHRPISGVNVAFLNIGLAGVIMLVLTPFIALGPVSLDWPIVLSLLTLGVLGTGVAYVWNVNVLRAWGPTNVSTVTYVTPVVGVALGILVLGETLSWNEPAGALLVIVGILFTQGRIRVGGRHERAGGQQPDEIPVTPMDAAEPADGVGTGGAADATSPPGNGR